jgi:hypothetical protein
MLRCVTSGDVSGLLGPGSDVEVSWADGTGRRCSCGLEDAGEIAFEEASPSREIPSYHGQRHFPGLWWLATTGRHVGYESWLERDHLIALDFDRLVTGVSSQPFILTWSQDGRTVSHTPDYFARLGDGSAAGLSIPGPSPPARTPLRLPVPTGPTVRKTHSVTPDPRSGKKYAWSSWPRQPATGTGSIRTPCINQGRGNTGVDPT